MEPAQQGDSEMADYYRFFPALYEVDAAHLTLAAHGAYRRLIDKYMTGRQPLPDNDRAIASLIGCALDEWLAVAAEVRPFFIARKGKLHQKRCDMELSFQDEKSKTRSEVAKKGAEKRWSNDGELELFGCFEHAESNAEGIASECQRRGEEIRGIDSSSNRPSADVVPFRPAMIEEEFGVFWATYPRCVGKRAAEKAYAKARKRATYEAIMAGLGRYCREKAGTDPTYIAHPTTWLNQDRWLDSAQAAPVDDLHNQKSQFRNDPTMWWDQRMGEWRKRMM